MNEDDEFIDSVEKLKKKLDQKHGIVAHCGLVRKVMREDLKMSYRRVKPISWTENSAKSKILRQ